MCNPVQSIVDAIVEKIVGKVFQSVGRHVGFLFHYKQKLKNLEDEMNNLQGQITNVEGKVNQANHRGEAIYNNVSDWLKDADKTREGVDKFTGEKTVKENIQCFNFSCPDFIWRYRLSKQAEKKAVRIKHLAESGSQIGPISHPRENPPELELPSSKDYEDFHSRQKVLKDIVEALKDSKVNMIGVYGTGGIGKTTMVEKVGKLLKEDGTFDEVVMAVVSHDANVIKVQGQLADRLKEKLNEETEVGRANHLWNRLDNGKKNIIILDDVWEELDLKKIGIPITDEKKSCKVVLTSRNRDVWKNMGVHKDYTIKILSQEEAWALFKKKVGDYVDSPGQPLLSEIAWAVCKECQGLPVAINALGVALKGKDMNAWQDALDKLKNSMLKEIEGINPKVYTSLKWSYDWLDSEDAKSCFLLCCLFPEDAEIQIDDLVRYYMAGRSLHHYQMPDTLEKALYRVCSVVSTLKSCGLLLDGNGEFLVKMHDVVRDVAISIAEDEKSFLVKHGFKDWLEIPAHEHRSIISLRPDDVRDFPDMLVCPDLHTLRLDCTGYKFWLQIPDNFFSRTEKLMVLDLKGVSMFPLLPSSFAKLAKLHMLCLNNCSLEDIAILKDLKDHLEILSLRGSDIKVLPPEVGELTGLRLLDMEDCNSLEMIPKGVISKLIRLEELYMPLSFDQWEGKGAERKISNVSLDELVSLTRLTTLHIWIPDTTLLPKDLTFENHVRFRIKFGQDQYYYGESSTGVLRLENFHSANTLEFLLGKPKWSIQRNGLCPSKFINHLTDLSVVDCGLKYLFSPSCSRGLARLQYLAIRNCTVMEGVIGTEGDKDEDILIIFSGLKTLNLNNLPNLISFYPKMEKTATSSGSSFSHAQTVLFNDKATFPALESLEIESVEKITEIWDKQMLPIQERATESPFCELSKLEIYDCSNLMNVVGGSPKLEAIVMDHKHKGKAVDDYHVTRFPKLKNLGLRRLRNLESFCSRSIRCEVLSLFDHQAAFPALESLEIDSVDKITEIWDKQVLPIQEIATESPFCELSKLDIKFCEKLMNVVGKEVDDYHVTRFPKLKNLQLWKLRNLESFCSRSMRCEAQVPLFDHQATFPALESLAIEYVEKITEIWDKQMLPIQEIATESPFCELTKLEIAFCEKLMNVVGGCPKLEAIVKEKRKGKEVDDYHVTRFPKLKNLRLAGLYNLESFCSRSMRCEAQVPLFDHQVEFPVLEELWISILNITDIWDKKLRPAESFRPLLRELYVFGCDKLVNVVRSNMLPQLRNLKKLSLDSCQIMEVIVDLEKREEEAQEAANNNTIIPFPELTEMRLERLQNVKKFCIIRSGEQPVFNAQVAFPKLENLYLISLGERALQQLLGAFELLSLKHLHLFKCDEVSTMSSPHFLRSLRNVGLLEVVFCEGVREVFHFDGLEVGDGQECVGRPSLIQVRMVELDDLPQLTCLWNKDPRVLLDLQNLEYLTIKNCHLLANLFTASVAKALVGLKGLCLSSCSTMEEVITTDEEGHKDVIDDDDDEIVFPKLERLILEDLPNLKSFCSSNHNLNFPSLQRVVLKKCPEVQTFTSGSVRMPQILLTASGNDGLVIEDLNKRLEQQRLKGDEEIIWGISEWEGGYDSSYYDLQYLRTEIRRVVGVGTSGVR